MSFSVRQGGLDRVTLTNDTPYGMSGRLGVSGGRGTEAEEQVLIGLPKVKQARQDSPPTLPSSSRLACAYADLHSAGFMDCN